MAAEYLIFAANRMYTLLQQNEVTDADLVEAAETGCRTLGRLAEDQAFEEAFVELTRRRSETSAIFDEIIGRTTESLAHFLSFVDAEQQILIYNGIRSDLSVELALQAISLIKQVRTWKGDIEMMRVLISQLRNGACAMAQAQRTSFEHQKKRGIRKKRLLRMAYAIGGSAIVVLNYTAPIGLTEAGTAVSGIVGSVLMGAAAGQVAS